jgi:hypothetical protein
MKQQRDLGSLVLAAAALLLCVSYMTQCRSRTDRNGPVAAATRSHAQAGQPRAHVGRDREPKSVQEYAAEEDKEEQEKRQSISRALQTIGADPKMRRTYGLPQ